MFGFLGGFLGYGSLPVYRKPTPVQASKRQQEVECNKLGWFPDTFGLKDHSIFIYDGYYYLISIYVPLDTIDPLAQDRFAYARSTDLCMWEQLDFVLSNRVPDTWDEAAVWAPYVYKENGLYYLFYTGVTQEGTQSILLSTTSDPSDPSSWQPGEKIFQPDHSDMEWEENEWADCRDPMVIKEDNIYYLYYTGKDSDGGIIGVAEAKSMFGTWIDRGGITDPDDRALPESPFVLFHDGIYYLFLNIAAVGEYYQTSISHLGSWSEEKALLPGWAHEFFFDVNEKLYTSYLTNFSVTISPVSWDQLFSPSRPVLSDNIFRHFLPQIINQ